MTTEPVLHELLSRAELALDRHSLEEASRFYHKVLLGVQAAEWTRCLEKYSVAALIGLSSIYSKTGRSLRYRVLEWQGMQLCAAAFLNEAHSTCSRVVAEKKECKKCMDWLQSAKDKAAYQRDILHKCIAKSIQQSVKTSGATESGVNTEWLINLQSYSRAQVKKLNTDIENTADDANMNNTTDNQAEVTEDANANIITDQTEAAEPETSKSKKKHINFDQVQAAIMRMVKQVSTDVRKRHVRKRITEDMLRRSVSCEMLSRSEFGSLWNPDSSFPGYQEESSEGSSTSPSPEPIVTTTELQTNSKYDELLLSCPCIFLASEIEDDGGVTRLNCSRAPDNVIDANCNFRESRSYTTANTNRPHILTIWRSFPQDESSPSVDIQPYSLPSFEELSPLTESSRFKYPPEPEPQTSSTGSSIQSSIERRINETLATLLQDIARRLLQQEDRDAEELLKFALGIVEYGSSRASDSTSCVIAGILRHLGEIKCERGDVTGGVRLMEEAAGLLGKARPRPWGEIAEIWHTLGDAYVVNLAQDGSLMEHSMRTVREHLDSEVIYEDLSLELDTDSDTSEGETYSVCIYEAIGCYNQAHELLSRPAVRDNHLDLYVDNLRRLGDCNIMVGNYDTAVTCYEEVIKLVKGTFGSEALRNNAHVLYMLGTANFLLANYHKAISIFETAYILQQKVLGAEEQGEECLFILMLIAISYFLMNQYHKSISWCLKAEECAQHVQMPSYPALSSLRSWFLAEVLFILGYSYSTVNFLQQSLTYLRQSRDVIVNESVDDMKLNVRVLKAIADAYAGLDDNEKAIEYYNQAIDLVSELGQERSATVLQNQLLNAMAGVHVSSNQYSHASQYLEQGLSCQKSVESSINSDLFSIMRRLGATYTITGDVEKAIECYEECLNSRGELPDSEHKELSLVLCNMGNLSLVKSCMEEDTSLAIKLLTQAKQWYEEALEVDRGPASAVQYANFWYQQGLPEEVLYSLLEVHAAPDTDTTLTYHGVCHAILPEHIQTDIDEVEEITFSADVLAYFLGVISYKSLGLDEDALACLEAMVRLVYRGDSGMNFSFLAYGLMELGLFLEAAECFALAAVYLDSKESARDNFWLCLLTEAYNTTQRVLHNIWLSLAAF